MLRLEWDSLRVGDRVLVHGGWDTELALAAGVVVMVDTNSHAPNGVGVRIGSADASHVVWPLYLAVHVVPERGDASCRRCGTIRESAWLARAKV